MLTASTTTPRPATREQALSYLRGNPSAGVDFCHRDATRSHWIRSSCKIDEYGDLVWYSTDFFRWFSCPSGRYYDLLTVDEVEARDAARALARDSEARS